LLERTDEQLVIPAHGPKVTGSNPVGRARLLFCWTVREAADLHVFSPFPALSRGSVDDRGERRSALGSRVRRREAASSLTGS